MDADDDSDVQVEVEEEMDETEVHPTSLDNKAPAFMIQHYQTGLTDYRPNCAVTTRLCLMPLRIHVPWFVSAFGRNIHIYSMTLSSPHIHCERLTTALV